MSQIVLEPAFGAQGYGVVHARVSNGVRRGIGAVHSSNGMSRLVLDLHVFFGRTPQHGFPGLRLTALELHVADVFLPEIGILLSQEALDRGYSRGVHEGHVDPLDAHPNRFPNETFLHGGRYASSLGYVGTLEWPHQTFQHIYGKSTYLGVYEGGESVIARSWLEKHGVIIVDGQRGFTTWLPEE